MIDKTKILTGLTGLVGLRQPDNPSYDILDNANITSRSGYYSNDNPYCKTELLLDNIDYMDASDVQKNAFIKHLYESAVIEVCNSVFDEADYIDRNLLYKNAASYGNTETLPSGFVGYKIEPCSKKNVAFEITRVFLNFKNSGTIKLLLFNSAINDPIFNKTITITSSNQVESLKWVVDNSGDYYKGEFYFGYIVDQMAGTLVPYARDYEDSVNKSIISNLSIENMYVPNVTTNHLWDISINQIGNSNCFGLNPDITVFNDYTDIILRNERMFARAIDLAYQIKIINSYIVSLRSNQNERISADFIKNAKLEIDGIDFAPGMIKKVGLSPTLRNEIVSIKNQIEKLKEGYFGKKTDLTLVTLS